MWKTYLRLKAEDKCCKAVAMSSAGAGEAEAEAAWAAAERAFLLEAVRGVECLLEPRAQGWAGSRSAVGRTTVAGPGKRDAVLLAEAWRTVGQLENELDAAVSKEVLGILGALATETGEQREAVRDYQVWEGKLAAAEAAVEKGSPGGRSAQRARAQLDGLRRILSMGHATRSTAILGALTRLAQIQLDFHTRVALRLRSTAVTLNPTLALALSSSTSLSPPRSQPSPSTNRSSTKTSWS